MVHFTLKNFLAGAALTLSCAAFAATDAPSFDWADYLQTAETTGTYVTNVAAEATELPIGWVVLQPTTTP